MKYLYTLFFIFLISFTYSQEKKTETGCDSIFLRKGAEFLMGGSKIIIKNDTILCLPDSIIQNNKDLKTNKFYNNVKKEAYKTKLTKELYKLTFSEQGKASVLDTIKVERGEKSFDNYSGDIIRNIKFKKIDVFGPTVNDTSRKADSWIEKTANEAHISTKLLVIKKNLLFKKGDKVNPFILANNERLLRNLPNINDAKIILYNASNDSVDVLIITKDVFPIGMDLQINSLKDGSIGFWNVNFLGYGNKISSTISYKSPRKPFLKFQEASYKVQNIQGSFISGEIFYNQENNNEEKTDYGVKFERKFIPLKIATSGYFEIKRTREYEFIYKGDSIFKTNTIKYGTQDVSVGHSINLSKSIGIVKTPEYLFVSGRILRESYYKRPNVNADTNQQYMNSTKFLASISISKQDFYIGNYIFGYGRTEDIPYGYLAKFTGGYELGELYNRPYFGLKLAKGNYVNNWGYYYVSSDVGGFLIDKQMREGTLKLEFDFITKIYNYKKFSSRHFVGINYTQGINQLKDLNISLSEDPGLSGLARDSLIGKKRFWVNLETMAYTPLSFLGFKLSVYCFLDMGLVGPSDKSIFSNKLYVGIGPGIKLRNENLVFKTIVVRLAYFPIIHDGSKHLDFTVSGESSYKFNNFNFTRPSIIKFE
ncbi:MAG: hypothetical protein JEY97_08455 [Bacteroidales bacterium]|nr:hypothetical protein [Bacteroidales bacterium]